MKAAYGKIPDKGRTKKLIHAIKFISASLPAKTLSIYLAWVAVPYYCVGWYKIENILYKIPK